MTNLPKLELEIRRIIFWCTPILSQKYEADLMLTLNELLQKASITAHTQFSRVRYLQIGVISALLMEKSSAKNLVKDYSNMLIRVAKSVNERVIRIEVLKC